VPYRWVDHTAELELHVEAPSPTLVLQEAMAALAELYNGATGEPETHELALEARDLASLLAEWLEELVYLAETRGFVAEQAEIVLRNTSLRAAVQGRRGEPRPLVKGVTYHGLELHRRNGGWQARVVLDV
jgi:SHS2 domain-containing protein